MAILLATGPPRHSVYMGMESGIGVTGELGAIDASRRLRARGHTRVNMIKGSGAEPLEPLNYCLAL